MKSDVIYVFLFHINRFCVGIRWDLYPSFACSIKGDWICMFKKLWTKWFFQYKGIVWEKVFNYTTLFIKVLKKIYSIISKSKYCQYALHVEHHVVARNWDDVLLLNDRSLPISIYCMIYPAYMLISAWFSGHSLIDCLMNHFKLHFSSNTNLLRCRYCVI